MKCTDRVVARCRSSTRIDQPLPSGSIQARRRPSGESCGRCPRLSAPLSSAPTTTIGLRAAQVRVSSRPQFRSFSADISALRSIACASSSIRCARASSRASPPSRSGPRAPARAIGRASLPGGTIASSPPRRTSRQPCTEVGQMGRAIRSFFSFSEAARNPVRPAQGRSSCSVISASLRSVPKITR